MISQNGGEQRLQEIRVQIDTLDEQMLALINQRAAAAQVVAEIKRSQGPDRPYYRPEREAEVLRRIKSLNRGPLDDEVVARLFRELMSACLALEQPLRIAFLGPEGTFTQAATLKHFGHGVSTVPLAAIPDVFRDVESDSCHYGVVPVENSTEGVISHTLDMFMRSPLRICGEVTLRIHHHLLTRAKSLAQIQRVYSHQQSLAQCRSWLDLHLPLAERLSVGSNAEAARRVSEGTTGDAAIAGEAAADLYGLAVLAGNIEDEPSNTTRFLVIGRRDAVCSGRDKTSLLMASRNEAGGLHALLTPFAEHGISMTRIESRPSRTSLWEYVFFVDIEGHREDPKTREAFTLLGQKASLFKVLGSYPMAEL
jgi:chorismate mutase/prephenate dehydratase